MPDHITRDGLDLRTTRVQSTVTCGRGQLPDRADKMCLVPRPYPEEFRDQVVAVVRRGKSSIKQVAKDFGISESCLRRWLRADDASNGAELGPTTHASVRPHGVRQPSQQAAQEHEGQALSFAELERRVPSGDLALPIRNPAELPLRGLDPAVLERLAAELVYRHDHRGVQFYGRSGQKQYGLDIVEHRPDGGYTLYQVKRLPNLTERQLRDAVKEYATVPRAAGYRLSQRKFGADRFVVVTSAPWDADTANVDALAALRAEYKGDLDIDVWGAEALSRRLRDLERVVHAVFGPAWAKEFCAFEMSPKEAAQPKPLGFVEHPASVLGLDLMLAEAQGAKPEHAVALYRTVANDLDQNGFPGHAAMTRRKEAEAALRAEDPGHALDAVWPAAVRSVERGERLLGLEPTLRKVAETGGALACRVNLLVHASKWAEHGTDLDHAVPWLEELGGMQDSELPLLAYLTMERALADGLFDFEPPRSVAFETDSSTSGLLSRLVNVTRVAMDTAVKPTARARLSCALADAALRAASPTADVEAAYAPLLTAAAAGRYHDAACLVDARAARASALHGNPSLAEDLWRRAVLAASEAGLYGDARGALRSITLLGPETGKVRWGDLAQAVQAMPDRRRLVNGGDDAMLYALGRAQAGKLPDALGHTRHGLLVAMVSGDLSAESAAFDLLGDVLANAGRPADAVECWVAAGEGKKAAKAVAAMTERADVSRWLSLPWRRRSDAAAQVIGRQANLVPDADAAAVIEELLAVSQGLWEAPWMQPNPEQSALDALRSFADRLPGAAIDRLLALCKPAIEAPTKAGPDVAKLLVQVYASQHGHRDNVAAALIQILGQPNPPHNAWQLVRQLRDVHEPLVLGVQALAESGCGSALLTLAEWRHAEPLVQQAARRACSALLRRPIVGHPDQGSISAQDWETVVLLLALLDARVHADFPAEEFSEAMAWSPGGAIMHVSKTAGKQPTSDAEDQPDQTQTTDSSADNVAQLCAGPPAALAEAVAAHLLDTAEDRTGLALARVQPLNALSGLLGRVEPAVAADMIPRLLGLHRDPGLTELDQSDIASNDPLSRIRLGGHGGGLAPAALYAAARAVRRAVEGGVADEVLRAQAAEAVAAAIPLLQSAKYARLAAGAVEAVATTDVGQENAALLLATHHNNVVKQIGARALPKASGLLRVLAADDSAAVRRAVAHRAPELDEPTVNALREDPDRTVRTALMSGDGPGA